MRICVVFQYVSVWCFSLYLCGVSVCICAVFQSVSVCICAVSQSVSVWVFGLYLCVSVRCSSLYLCVSVRCFSLNHLSLTSRLLRDVCSSLLNSRGLVMLLWSRIEYDEGVTWRPVAQVPTQLTHSQLTTHNSQLTQRERTERGGRDTAALVFVILQGGDRLTGMLPLPQFTPCYRQTLTSNRAGVWMGSVTGEASLVTDKI